MYNPGNLYPLTTRLDWQGNDEEETLVVAAVIAKLVRAQTHNLRRKYGFQLVATGVGG